MLGSSICSFAENPRRGSSNWPQHRPQLQIGECPSGLLVNPIQQISRGWIYFIVLGDFIMTPTGTEKEGPELWKEPGLLVRATLIHTISPVMLPSQGTMLLWLSLTSFRSRLVRGSGPGAAEESRDSRLNSAEGDPCQGQGPARALWPR